MTPMLPGRTKLSVSMIGSIPAMFYVGTFLASLGFLATLNGFFLFV